MRYRKIAFIVFVSASIVMVTQSYLWSGVTGKIVETVILKDYSSSLGEYSPKQKAKLWEEISSPIHFEEMSKRSLGKQWHNLQREQKDEFIRLFTKNIKTSYMNNAINLHGGKIVSIKEKQGKKHAKVLTQLLTKRGKEISVVFYFFNENEDWKIYDVTIEGVSLVKNYYHQFQCIIARTSYDGLIRMMRQKHDNHYTTPKRRFFVLDKRKRLS
ncbi:MAG: ABC transporter substrate-binding protein [Planctomycetes bacterium]|nr:ABC transporter substrate-binding protein [Planctomycetota bacterium]